MGGRPKASLALAESEREQLRAWERSRSVARALALRARIVLLCADGLDNRAIALRLKTSEQTVSKWRGRFLADRLAGLRDAPRSGAPRTIDEGRVSAVIARTLEHVRTGAASCSTRSMAREMGMSHMAISRIWRQFGLQPHRPETLATAIDHLTMGGAGEPIQLDRVRASGRGRAPAVRDAAARSGTPSPRASSGEGAPDSKRSSK